MITRGCIRGNVLMYRCSHHFNKLLFTHSQQTTYLLLAPSEILKCGLLKRLIVRPIGEARGRGQRHDRPDHVGRVPGGGRLEFGASLLETGLRPTTLLEGAAMLIPMPLPATRPDKPAKLGGGGYFGLRCSCFAWARQAAESQQDIKLEKLQFRKLGSKSSS
jgi:hypothetical protein